MENLSNSQKVNIQRSKRLTTGIGLVSEYPPVQAKALKLTQEWHWGMNFITNTAKTTTATQTIKTIMGATQFLFSWISCCFSWCWWPYSCSTENSKVFRQAFEKLYTFFLIWCGGGKEREGRSGGTPIIIGRVRANCTLRMYYIPLCDVYFTFIV